jgi:DNA (cytosine-5)-methyltransferase 1
MRTLFDELTNKKENQKINKFKDFTFIDLFSGIGGFHIAMHNIGGKCVFSSEWDEAARDTYQLNFKKISPELFDKNMFVGDITKFDPSKVPNHDILCAGFPCQPFSQAGLKLGFEDTRGTLFFNIAQIIKAKRPKVILLENVRGLLSHDKGKTFNVIRNTIEELGYSFYYKIIRASDFGLPQHRPRIFIVGFNDRSIEFEFPEPVKLNMTMNDVFGGKVNKSIGYTLRVGGKKSPLNDRRNWDGYLVDGVEKRVGIKEAKKMQGFPDTFEFSVSISQAMKQLGNSVAIPVVEALGKSILSALNKENE